MFLKYYLLEILIKLNYISFIIFSAFLLSFFLLGFDSKISLILFNL